MEDSGDGGLFISLARIISGTRSARSICADTSALLASSPGYRRCSVIMERAEGVFAVAAASRPDGTTVLESLLERCTGPSVPFIGEILGKKIPVITGPLPEGMGLSAASQKAVVGPLICRGKGVGIIIVEADNPGERDLKTIEAVSRFVSIGIENQVLTTDSVETRLQLVHELETFQLMYEIGKEILSNHKTEEIVGTVIQMIRRVVPCDGVSAALFDKAGGMFTVRASWGTGLDRGQEIGREETPFYHVMESGRPFYQHDITLDFRDYPRLQEWAAEKNVFSYFCLPLNVKGDSWGILVLSSMRPVWFTKTHMSAAEKITTQVGIALENALLLHNVEELFLGTVKSLVAAIDAKSKWTKGHSLRVAEYALRFAEKIGFDKNGIERLELAALLHDIGKIGTYESILDKPGPLTPEEREMIRKHPSQGAEIISPLKTLNDLIPAIRHHHERYDGAGYPDGLAGEDIPHEARVLALADSYDAMLSDRPYRRGLSPDAAVSELRNGAGTQFDPSLAALFIDMVSE